MWQVKTPFLNEAEKEALLGRACLFDFRGSWELETELILYFESEEGMNGFTASSGDRQFLKQKVLDKIDWLTQWKKFHRVIRIKPFVIVPAFRKEYVLPAFYSAKIVINPSFAFGTGSHPTTKMCLKYLIRTVRKGSRVLDMGTGTAILAICAEKMGAEFVLGVDNDSVALGEARKNMVRNRCSRISLSGKLARSYDRSFDICVCNILLDDILSLKDRLQAAVKSGGWLILSGLLATQADEVAAAYGDRFKLVSSMIMKDRSFQWTALLLRRS